MASNDDILSAIKGVTQNISQLVSAMGAPGRTVSAQTSPLATLQTALGTTALQIVAFNVNRRALSVHSCDPAGNTTIFFSPSNTVSTTAGIALLPGQSMFIGPDFATNSAWSAIALASGNSILMLEYV